MQLFADGDLVDVKQLGKGDCGDRGVHHEEDGFDGAAQALVDRGGHGGCPLRVQ
jgi:hypothetical protein